MWLIAHGCLETQFKSQIPSSKVVFLIFIPFVVLPVNTGWVMLAVIWCICVIILRLSKICSRVISMKTAYSCCFGTEPFVHFDDSYVSFRNRRDAGLSKPFSQQAKFDYLKVPRTNRPFRHFSRLSLTSVLSTSKHEKRSAKPLPLQHRSATQALADRT